MSQREDERRAKLSRLFREIGASDTSPSERENLLFQALYVAQRLGYRAHLRRHTVEPNVAVASFELPDVGVVSWPIAVNAPDSQADDECLRERIAKLRPQTVASPASALEPPATTVSDSVVTREPEAAANVAVPIVDSNGARILVLVHIGYRDLWPELARFVAAAHETPGLAACDLYVNLSEPTPDLEEWRARIVQQFPNAVVSSSEDRGMDIGPTLRMIAAARRRALERGTTYDALLKLHTKRNEGWRRQLVDGVCNDSKACQAALLTLLSNPRVGMVGTRHRWLLPVPDQAYDRTSALARKLGLSAPAAPSGAPVRPTHSAEWLDCKFYTRHYTDLQRMNPTDALRHWRVHGMGEGRSPNETVERFDANFYRAQNAETSRMTDDEARKHWFQVGLERHLPGFEGQTHFPPVPPPPPPPPPANAVPPPAARFIGGTIFWMRWSVVERFLDGSCADGSPRDLDLLSRQLEPRRSGRNSLTQDWERLFGLLVYDANLETVGM
ncbi:Hypothetical protein UVM_LOCUS23 [uncultured virus]|nr:Hypothetical protein UVM_LOCUS23 [uncultured virus]